MEISYRLQTIAQMVTTYGCVADVGCDHAYTSLYLIDHGLASHVIAMDVRTGPLSRAIEHVQKAGRQDVIECRLSDGLEALSEQEADTILISGMGGILMANILSAYPNTARSAKELILQPQSELPLFRQQIHQLGFYLDDEKIIRDEGKLYTMMRAKPGVEQEPYTPEDYLFGKILRQKREPVWVEFMQKEMIKTRQLLEKLGKGDTPDQKKRIMELNNYVKALKSGGF